MSKLTEKIFKNSATEEEILSFLDNLDDYKQEEKELLEEWSSSKGKLDSNFSEELFKKIEAKVQNREVTGSNITAAFADKREPLSWLGEYQSVKEKHLKK